VNADFERKLVAAEDARQVLFNVELLEGQADEAEAAGRLATAVLLNETAARLLRRYVALMDIAEGKEPAKPEPRGLDPLATVLRAVFSLPVALLLAVGGLVARLLERKPAEAPVAEPVQPAEPPVVAVPVAIPINLDEVPTADLAPVLQLPYFPEPEAKPKAKRQRKPKAKPVPMPSAARTTTRRRKA
jgi:hypothetical protein